MNGDRFEEISNVWNEFYVNQTLNWINIYEYLSVVSEMKLAN